MLQAKKVQRCYVMNNSNSENIPPLTDEELARMKENRRKRLQRAQTLKQAV